MEFKNIDATSLYDKYLRVLNPSGEHSNSEGIFTTSIRLGRIKSEDDVKQIAKSYKEYVDEWTTTFGSADQVYVSKENRLKSFGEFYNAGMHKSKSFSKMDSRYMYLFGQKEYGEIEEKFRIFKEKTSSPWE